MITHDQVIALGVLTRTHGCAGELQCRLDHDCWPEDGVDFVVLDMDAILTPFRVEDWRYKGADSLLLTLSGYDSEADVASLVQHRVYLLRRDLTADEDDLDVLTWQDLCGYTVSLPAPDGTCHTVGTISEVDESTLNTLAVLDNGRLLPLHEDLILALDEQQHTLTLNIAEPL